MTERILLALPLLAISAGTLYAARRRSPLEPSVLLVLCTALVGSLYPLGSALVRPLTWRHGAYLPAEVVSSAQLAYLGFAAGACAVVACARRGGARAPFAGGATAASMRRPGAVVTRDAVVATGLVVAGALLYAVYVSKVGLGPLLDRSNFAEKYRVSGGLGSFYFGLHLVIAGCLWAEASRLPKRAAWAFRAVAALVLVWSIAFVAVRTYAVALLLGYLYLWCRNHGFQIARVRLSLVLALALSYAGVEAYGVLRGVWQGSLVDAVQMLKRERLSLDRAVGQVVGGSELAHPFLTTMELLHFEEPGELLGSSYAGAVTGLLPLALVPERKPTPAQEFARRHYPSLEARGGGTAFSIVGEAWWNFGALIGPLLAGVVLALLLRCLERDARVAADGVVARLLPYGVHLVLLLHRNSSAALAKQAFAILLPVGLLVAAAHLAHRALAVRRGSPRSSGPRIASIEQTSAHGGVATDPPHAVPIWILNGSER